MRHLLLALCVLPACTVRCGSVGDSHLDVKEQAELLARQMGEAADAVAGVYCPDLAPGHDRTFECQVDFQDHTTVAIDGALTGGTLSLNWRKIPLGSSVRKHLATELSKRTGEE